MPDTDKDVVWVPVRMIPLAVARHLRDLADRLHRCDGVDDTALTFLRLILEDEADSLVS